MKLYIPTFGRSDRQVTYDGLPPALQRHTKLVVQRSEAKLYDGYPIIVLPPSITTIAPTRQWIITSGHTAFGGGDPLLVMLDDDLRWSKRRTDDYAKFLACDAKDTVAMFKLLEGLLKRYTHASIHPREGAHARATLQVPVLENVRLTRVLGYNMDRLKLVKPAVKFNRLPLQEDFDVTLQLLRAGHANAVINTYVHNQDGSNARGGCSTFRTPAMQAESSEALAALHDPFVKVVTRTRLKAWGGLPRTDVFVRWKQAYKSSKVAA